MFVILFLIAGAIPQGAAEEAIPAAASIQLAPSLPSPQPVGTKITWTVIVSGISSPFDYRLSVALSSDPLRVMYDYSPQNTFGWVPIDEGTYTVAAAVRILSTGKIVNVPSTYTIASRVTDQPIVTPTANPLVAFYSAPPRTAGNRMHVQFWKKDTTDVTVTTPKLCKSGRSVNFYIAGMLEQSVYYMRFQVLNSSGVVVENGPELSFRTGAVTVVLPTREVLKQPGDMSCFQQNVVLQSPVACNPSIPFATDLWGQVLWYVWYVDLSRPSTVWRPVTGGTFLGAIVDENGLQGQILREIDLLGYTVRQTTAQRISEQLVAMGQDPLGAIHHETRRLPNGHTAVICSVERIMKNTQGTGPVDILGDYIVVLNKNWQVVWVWNSFDHLDPTRRAILNEKCIPNQAGCRPVTLAPQANDWLHSNAIVYSPVDGSFMLSMRNQDWIIKIDYRDGAGTGDVIWRLGPEGDFTIASSDPYPWFTHQHDPNYVADNRLVVYDNGNTRCADNTALCYSRGQVYTIDEKTMTASLNLNANLRNYSIGFGSAQPLLCGTFDFNSGIHDSPFAISDEVLSDRNITYRLKVGSQVYRSFRMLSLYSIGETSSQTDTYGDGIPDSQDNCPNNFKVQQLDADGDDI